MAKNSSSPLVFIDAGHGGSDPGAVSGNHRESGLARGIVKLLSQKFLDEKKVRALLTHDAAGKDFDADFWKASDRAAFLRGYNKNTERIDYLLSIHLNAATSETASGLVICHNNRPIEAQTMYDVMVEAAKSEGIDIAGNRVEKIQDRPGLAVLRASIAGIFEKNGIKFGNEGLAEEFLAYLKEATDSYELGTGISLSQLVQSKVSGLISGIMDLKTIGLPNGEKGKARKKIQGMEAGILAGLSGIFPSYSDAWTAMLHVGESGGESASTRVPALLIETGFISNTEDCLRIAGNPSGYASWIGEGQYKILEI